MLGVQNLECLPPASSVATRESDQATDYHARFYARMAAFLPTYYRFVLSVLADSVTEVYIQRVPTFRVHLRGSVAVGTWHRDSEFFHTSSETNYWVPLTRAFGTNSLWIESRPVAADVGDVVVFLGSEVLHGNLVNTTPISRVSFDFRTLPRADYRASDLKSVSAGVPMTLDGYWIAPEEISVDAS